MTLSVPLWRKATARSNWASSKLESRERFAFHSDYLGNHCEYPVKRTRFQSVLCDATWRIRRETSETWTARSELGTYFSISSRASSGKFSRPESNGPSDMTSFPSQNHVE